MVHASLLSRGSQIAIYVVFDCINFTCSFSNAKDLLVIPGKIFACLIISLTVHGGRMHSHPSHCQAGSLQFIVVLNTVFINSGYEHCRSVILLGGSA